MCVVNCAPATSELRTTQSDSAWVTACGLVCAFARNRSPRTSPRFVFTRDGLAITHLLNHHDPVHVTSFLRLSGTVRLFRGSASFRPTFAPFVSCLCHNFCMFLGTFLDSACLSQNSFLSHCLPFLCSCLWTSLCPCRFLSPCHFGLSL